MTLHIQWAAYETPYTMGEATQLLDHVAKTNVTNASVCRLTIGKIRVKPGVYPALMKRALARELERLSRNSSYGFGVHDLMMRGMLAPHRPVQFDMLREMTRKNSKERLHDYLDKGGTIDGWY